MEKVSEEVLDRMLADYIRTSDSCKGGKGPSYMVQALTELRELRKVMGALDKKLDNKDEFTECQVGRTADGKRYYAAITHDSSGRGHSVEIEHADSLLSALAALVKGG